jgi:hypothetical protein
MPEFALRWVDYGDITVMTRWSMRRSWAGLLILSLFSAAALAQHGTSLPLTADGRPDLHGVWVNRSATPLERPAEVNGQSSLTVAEVAELQRRADRLVADDTNDAVLGDNLFLAAWTNVSRFKNPNTTAAASAVEPRMFENRTSLIVDPPDGQIPYTPRGRLRLQAMLAARVNPPDNPENLANEVRCLTYEVPRLRGGQVTYVDIVQTQDYVVMSLEQIHEVRIIPLKTTPHASAVIRRWNGDARGRWEGQTLVVDTTNFTAENNFVGSDEKLHLVERITRVGPDAIDYETTLDDPTAWTRPWTALVHLTRSSQLTYEFACHEGNYAIMGILSGARAAEKR